MSQPSLEELRAELRQLGYLSRGIERWFALDPRRSRTFWLQLFTVAGKAALLIAPFIAAPLSLFLASRNHLAAGEVIGAALLYAVAALAVIFFAVVSVALAMRLRAEAAIENPRIVTMLAIVLTTLLELALGAFWYAYPRPPEAIEASVGIALLLLLFGIAVTVFGAALLSFSIFETQHLPRVRRSRQGALLSGALTLIILALTAPLFLRGEPKVVERPPQVVVGSSRALVALLAVDGLSSELATARRELIDQFRHVAAVAPLKASSPAEEWATIGTGTLAATHGVHAVDGIRLRGSSRVLQSISRADFVLRQLAPALALARREPLPPTARRRDYVWELLASRGVPSVAVNWWSSRAQRDAALVTIPQEAILAQAAKSAGGNRERLAAAIDSVALAEVWKSLPAAPRFVTVYLPALDILLNRLALDPGRKVASSLRAVDPLVAAITRLRAAGYEVVLIGMPGEGEHEHGIVASTGDVAAIAGALDLAPTLCDLYAFPASAEMIGRSRVPGSSQKRIPSFGSRMSDEAPADRLSPDYYENLKSLGYIR